ncbi:MAG TPA: hypothetical protein VHD56_01630, partial [Tepidisphaeraceae bacterium]|nr:hypothetical protein [Tepidisphaeraceae bacterium]
EDLHIDGRVMDLTVRRTHLSHALLTSDMGRNWDWMGNMRLVELPHGEVHLMNGESQVEVYKPIKGNEVAAITITQIRMNEFDYSKIYDQRQYHSPAGAYKSLLKGKPVVLGVPVKPNAPGAAAAPATNAAQPPELEEARYYLVDKHGTIWTFAEDARFRGNLKSKAPAADEAANAHEPIPGVRGHWVLISIHDRCQKNSIRFQRDASESVRGILDDRERVIEVKNKAADASFDRFVSDMRDFGSRAVSYAMEERNLVKVSGPTAKNVSPSACEFRYGYTAPKEENGGGPSRRLKSVVDPLGCKNSTKEVPAIPVMRIDKWDADGRVGEQTVHSIVDVAACTANIAAELLKIGRDVKKPVAYKCALKFSGDANGQTKWEVEYEEIDEQTKPSKRRVKYKVAKEGKRPFAEIQSRIAFSDEKTTHEFKMEYDDLGEMKAIASPEGSRREWTYEQSGSKAGNLTKLEVLNEKKESVSLQSFFYGKEGGLQFNYPTSIYKKVSVDRDTEKMSETQKGYDAQGCQISNKLPKVDEKVPDTSLPADTAGQESSSTWNDDGLLSESVSLRKVTTSFRYYGQVTDHRPGDAHDLEGMLAMICQNWQGEEFDAKKSIQANQWEKLKVWKRFDVKSILKKGQSYQDINPDEPKNYPNGFVSTRLPDIFGNEIVTVDPDGISRSNQVNELGMVIGNDRGITFEYCASHFIDRIAGSAPIERVVSDSLGNVLARQRDEVRLDDERTVDQCTVAVHNFEGLIFRRIGEAGYEELFIYDGRNLLLSHALDTRGVNAIDEFEYDGVGNCVFHQDAEGWCEAWRFDSGIRLTHSLSMQGLLTAHEYGTGSYIKKTTQSELQAIPAEDIRNWLSIKQKKDRIAALAKMLKAQTPPTRSVLRESEFHRDIRGRIVKEFRLWQVSGGEAKRSVVQTKWSNDNLVTGKSVDGVLSATNIYDHFGRQIEHLSSVYDIETLYNGPRITRSIGGNFDITEWMDESAREKHTYDNYLLYESAKESYSVLNQLVEHTTRTGKETFKYDNAGRRYERSLSTECKTSPTFDPAVAGLPSGRTSLTFTNDYFASGQLSKSRTAAGKTLVSETVYQSGGLFGPKS